MNEIPSLFDPAALVHGKTEIDGGPGLPVAARTVAQQWAYAISLARTGRRAGTSVVVRAQMRLLSGSVGVGVLDAGGSAFIDERIIDAAGEHIVDLVVLDPADVGQLVLRNTSAAGASQAALAAVQCFECDPDAIRSPGLSEPAPIPDWARYYGTSGGNAVERLRVLRFERLGEAIQLNWSDGLSLRIQPRDQLSRAVYVSGTYEPSMLRILQRVLARDDTFLDVGANAGVVAVAAARWVGPGGRVYAFEPSSREFDRLTDTVNRNSAHQIQTIRAAVGAQIGAGVLSVAEEGYGGLNTLGERFAYDGVATARLEPVEVIALDAFARAQGISRVAAVKLDIEGGEAQALAGAVDLLARCQPVLIVEVSDRALRGTGSSAAALGRFLDHAGYAVFGIHDSTGQLQPLRSLDDVEERNVAALPRARAAELARTLER